MAATDVCEAVYTALSGATLAGSPSVALNYLPVFTDEGQGAAAAKIQIYLSNRTWQIENRCPNTTQEYTISLAFYEYLAPASDGTVSNSSLTTMLDLVEQVAGVMRDAGAMNGFRLQEITEAEPFDFQRLYESGIFQTTLALRYKG